MASTCAFCDKMLVWPDVFDCYYCQKQYCDMHSLAENHKCPKVIAAKHIEKDWLRKKGQNITTGRYLVVCKQCGYKSQEAFAIDHAEKIRQLHTNMNECKSDLVILREESPEAEHDIKQSQHTEKDPAPFIDRLNDDMPEGLRRLQRDLEKQTSQPNEKDIEQNANKTNRAKKGFFKNIFRRSKHQEPEIDTNTPAPQATTRTFASDEERITSSDEPYEILGVTKNNTFEQITQAYKRLQKNYLQIDLRNKTAEERKAINTILIKIDKAYSKIRRSHHASLHTQQHSKTKYKTFHSEEDRILNSPDPFQILNVSPNATSEEIKRNYKELQLKYKLTGMINKPKAEVLRLESLLKKVNWAYTEIKNQRF